MTVDEIYTYINIVLNKDQQGNSLSPDEYNNILEKCIFEFTLEGIANYKRMKMAADPSILTEMDFHELLQTTSISLDVAGTYSFPTTFLTHGAIHATFASMPREVEVVSVEEYYKRLNNLLAKPTDYYPVCYISGTTMYFSPMTLTSVTLVYYNKPTQPVYDYYIDANDNVIFMTAGSTHTLTTGETYSDNTTTGLKTSKTVELNLLEHRHQKFAEYILAKLGTRSRDQLLLQSSEMNKVKP